MLHTYSNNALRGELRRWIGNDGYTHALTLNTDRELALPRIRSIFSTFCHRFDKAVLGSRNVRSAPADHRLRAIAFPEHLQTNAHLHVSADLTFALAHLGEQRLRKEIRCAWLQSTRGAGSVDIQLVADVGWARYQTKDFRGTDYFLSSDFFPN
jgi:hypothetical protein